MYEYMSNSSKTINKITRIYGELDHMFYLINTSRDWICTQVFIIVSTTHWRPRSSLPLSIVGTFSCQISDEFEFEFWMITRSYWGTDLVCSWRWKWYCKVDRFHRYWAVHFSDHVTGNCSIQNLTPRRSKITRCTGFWLGYAYSCTVFVLA